MFHLKTKVYWLRKIVKGVVVWGGHSHITQVGRLFGHSVWEEEEERSSKKERTADCQQVFQRIFWQSHFLTRVEKLAFQLCYSVRVNISQSLWIFSCFYEYCILPLPTLKGVYLSFKIRWWQWYTTSNVRISSGSWWCQSDNVKEDDLTGDDEVKDFWRERCWVVQKV